MTTVPTTDDRLRRRPAPSTDNTGTLVDNGDGSYKYTFYRDITKDQGHGRCDDRDGRQQQGRPRRPDL